AVCNTSQNYICCKNIVFRFRQIALDIEELLQIGCQLLNGPISVSASVPRGALAELTAQNHIAIPCFLNGRVIHLAAIDEITIPILPISESSDACSNLLSGKGLDEMLKVAGIQSIEIIISHCLLSSNIAHIPSHYVVTTESCTSVLDIARHYP